MCLAICMPECLNNGVCIAPHQCDCPDDFTGPQCQFENKPCMEYPPPVFNSHKLCNSKYVIPGITNSTFSLTCRNNFN